MENLKNGFNVKLLGILVIIALALGVQFSPVLSAPLLDQAQVNPTDDGFAHTSFGSLDDFTLVANYDGFPTNSVTGYALLKFDLTAATTGWTGGAQIETARLNLANLACNGAYNVNASLWGMPDSFDGWSEGSMPSFASTDTAFGGATSLVSNVDEGTVDSTVIDYYHWTDNGGGTFATWLQSQRGGDGVVTLVLIPVSSETVQVSFADRELTESGGQCPETLGPPVLQISGNGQPTAVQLTTLEASQVSSTTLLALGAVAVLVLVAGAYLVIRRKPA